MGAVQMSTYKGSFPLCSLSDAEHKKTEAVYWTLASVLNIPPLTAPVQLLGLRVIVLDDTRRDCGSWEG
jgi:hypothetical protein